MKKRIFTLMLLLLAATFAAEANPVDLRCAREVAMRFMNANAKTPLRGLDDLQLVTTYNISCGDAAFYVFNTPNGFVIVSADDCATPILGYSNEGQFDVENIPIQLQEYLQDFVEQIQYGIVNHLEADERTVQQWELVKTIGWLTNIRTDETVEPLVSTIWNQNCYYNAMCPEDENGPCGRVYAGCVATAMAQIMRYWSYPERGTGSLSYTPPGYPEQSVNFGATTYDWGNMPNSLEASSSPEQISAVATLIWHCGVSTYMQYGYDGSGTVLYYNTLIDYFNYSDELSMDYRNNYSDASWKAKLKDCLSLGRPIYYCGSSVMSAHAFVCDGYDNNDMFHFNLGWSGSHNGYYAINALYGYNSSQLACFNIHPQGETTNYVINVSASNDEGGSVSGGGTFAHGTDVTLTATPNNGYHFCYWQENGGIASTNPNYSFTANYNRNLVAVFAEPFLITVSSTEGGVVSGGGSYAYGASCTVVATPDEGYAFSYWLEDGNVVSCDSEYSFTVTSERNLTARFLMSDGIISFDDANVKAVCLANWDTNGDGGLSYAEAAAVTSLGQVFRGNTTITSFDELQYFIGLTSIDNFAFYNCRNLTGLLSAIPSSVTRIGNYAFYGCTGFTGSLNVPISVTEIGYSAFQGCSGFTGGLTIHDSVTSIASNAFYGCINFETITVETGNSYYDSRENCNALINTLTDELVFGCKNTVIPNSVTSIGNNAFYNCRGLTGSLVIPNSVDTIGSCAFYNCSGLTGSLVIPSSVMGIGASAFQGCSGFTGSLTIPDSVIEIGASAFQGCSGFTGSLIIGNSVTWIGNRAFYDCSGFSGSLIIPNSVIEIDDSAFSYCNGFSGSLTIPSSVMEIGASAFRGCSGFSGSLTIGDFVMDIDNNAFYGCSGLTSIVFLSYDRPYLGQHIFDNIPTDVLVFVRCGLLESFQNDWDYSLDIMEMCYSGTITAEASPSLGGMIAGDGTYEDGSFCTVSAMPNEGYCFALWTENDRVVSIDADYSFIVTGDRSLTAVFVVDGNIAFADDNVKSICVTQWDTNGDGELSYAEAAAVTSLGQFFKGNTEITSFEELQYFIGLASIGNGAFYGCSNLTGSLIIPRFVISIGSYAFQNCSGFTGSLNIPNSVTTIGSSAFRDCSGFIGGLTIGNSVTSIGNSAFYGCSGFTGSLNIPNSVINVYDYAFYGCSGFTGSLTIGNSVNRIGYSAFQDCSGFTGSLSIGNSVTVIGGSAFQDCSGFTGSLNIPNSVTTIYDYAFYGCSGFTGNLTIGNSVTVIGGSAFQDCSGFTGSLTIGNSVTEIGGFAFQNCSGFAGNLNIPNSVIAIYDAAFDGCSGFTGNLTIGNSVTEIGYYAFENCSGFTGNLTIGNSVAEIGNYAFSGCSGLTSIIAHAEMPPTIYYGTFYDCPKAIPVYVPCGSLDAYQSAAYWNEFTNILESCLQQTITLSEGWNWISLYVELGDPVEVLQMLEAALGDNATVISASEMYTEYYGNGSWIGDLDEVGITIEQMYMVEVVNDCEVTLKGTVANPAYHTITIYPGWNWIGFPSGQELNLEDALADFEAEEGDQLAGAELYTEYGFGMWIGDVATLVPGQGYMYFSNSNETKTLVFRTGAKAKVDSSHGKHRE